MSLENRIIQLESFQSQLHIDSPILQQRLQTLESKVNHLQPFFTDSDEQSPSSFIINPRNPKMSLIKEILNHLIHGYNFYEKLNSIEKKQYENFEYFSDMIKTHEEKIKEFQPILLDMHRISQESKANREINTHIRESFNEISLKNNDYCNKILSLESKLKNLNLIVNQFHNKIDSKVGVKEIQQVQLLMRRDFVTTVQMDDIKHTLEAKLERINSNKSDLSHLYKVQDYLQHIEQNQEKMLNDIFKSKISNFITDSLTNYITQDEIQLINQKFENLIEEYNLKSNQITIEIREQMQDFSKIQNQFKESIVLLQSQFQTQLNEVKHDVDIKVDFKELDKIVNDLNSQQEKLNNNTQFKEEQVKKLKNYIRKLIYNNSLDFSESISYEGQARSGEITERQLEHEFKSTEKQKVNSGTSSRQSNHPEKEKTKIPQKSKFEQINQKLDYYSSQQEYMKEKISELIFQISSMENMVASQQDKIIELQKEEYRVQQREVESYDQNDESFSEVICVKEINIQREDVSQSIEKNDEQQQPLVEVQDIEILKPNEFQDKHKEELIVIKESIKSQTMRESSIKEKSIKMESDNRRSSRVDYISTNRQRTPNTIINNQKVSNKMQSISQEIECNKYEINQEIQKLEMELKQQILRNKKELAERLDQKADNSLVISELNQKINRRSFQNIYNLSFQLWKSLISLYSNLTQLYDSQGQDLSRLVVSQLRQQTRILKGIDIFTSKSLNNQY